MYELAPVSVMGYNDYSFGKTKKIKKHIGWCIKNGRIVKVYKIKGLTGKRYYDKKKVPKRTCCYKTKKAATKKAATKKAATKKLKKNDIIKKHTGWCIKKRRAVKVYKIKGLTGKRYYDKKKVPKMTRCYKTKRAAQNAIGTRKSSTIRKSSTRRKKEKVYYFVNRRTGNKTVSKPVYHKFHKGLLCSEYKSKDSCNLKKARCEWANNRCKRIGQNDFGLIPANRYNYQVQQYATNEGTPTLEKLDKIGGTAAWAYPTSSNYAWYQPVNNMSGYGF